MVGTGGYDDAGETLPSTEDIAHGNVITDFEDLDIDDGVDEPSQPANLDDEDPDEDYF